VKHPAITLSLLLILICGSPATHNDRLQKEDDVIRAIPPTFITLEPVKDCDDNGKFPQTNPLPYYTNATQNQFSCEFYEKDHVAWAMVVFYELWEREFGDKDRKLFRALEKISIVWSKDVKEVENVYDIDGNFLEKAIVSGLMVDDTTIWVWAEDHQISETSFIHELAHIALTHTCGDPDADHEGEKFLCWDDRHSAFIDNVNQVLSSTYGL